MALRQLPPRPFVLSLVATVALLLTPSVASAAWTVGQTPSVDGASNTSLSAVDCSSANSCMAVGHANSAALAERWDGASWQIVPTPEPPGATFSSLSGVSCPWPNVCFAVGSSDSGPLVELWDGTRWSIKPSPAIPNGALGAVSCSGLLACTAVGTDATGTLAERWDGRGWHVQSTPKVPGSDFSQLAGVSCPLKRTCTAVGQSARAGVTSPLVERWFGRVNSWGLQAAPKPDVAEGASLTGVSCPDGPVCFAVGNSISHPDPSATVTATLAERRIGSTWSVMATPNPQDSGFAQLLGVSCPGRTVCHAVGNGFMSGPVTVSPIAERFDGASWRLESVPIAPAIPFAFLAGVSCHERIFCMAVGGYTHLFLGATLAAKWTP